MVLDFTSVFLQKFLEVVLPVLATAIAGLVIAWINKVVAEVKIRLGEDWQWALEAAVEAAVMAAEQVNLHGELVDKKEYALTFAENWLSERGVKVSLAVLDAKIEAAVWEVINRDKQK